MLLSYFDLDWTYRPQNSNIYILFDKNLVLGHNSNCFIQTKLFRKIVPYQNFEKEFISLLIPGPNGQMDRVAQTLQRLPVLDSTAQGAQRNLTTRKKLDARASETWEQGWN